MNGNEGKSRSKPLAQRDHAFKAVAELLHLYHPGANKVVRVVMIVVPHRDLQRHLAIVGQITCRKLTFKLRIAYFTQLDLYV